MAKKTGLHVVSQSGFAFRVNKAVKLEFPKGEIVQVDEKYEQRVRESYIPDRLDEVDPNAPRGKRERKAEPEDAPAS